MDEAQSSERVVQQDETPMDQVLDFALRPKNISEYVGQEKIKNNLSILVEAAKKRREPIEHVLLYGPPGLGKTTLAHLIASELGVNIKITSGPAIEKSGDLAAILTALQPNDVLFIDEIHRLNRVVEEILYPAMEDYCLDIVIGQGPAAKVVRLNLPPFTLIGATTKFGKLGSPLRDRFGSVFHLDFYSEDEIQKIISRSAQLLGIQMTPDASKIISARSRKTPRIANRLLKRVRDYAQVRGDGTIQQHDVDTALELLGVDALGLDATDRRLLTVLIEQFRGGPAGLSTLAAAMSEEVETIEDVYEPFLLQLGMIQRTPRGRIASLSAYEHLKITPHNYF